MVALVFVWVAFYARSHKELFQVLLIPAVFCTLAFLGFLGFYQLRVGVIRPGLFFAYVNEFGALPLIQPVQYHYSFLWG